MSKTPNWAIKAHDIFKFHENKIKELGQALFSKPRGSKEGWSIRDTAREFNMTAPNCHKYLIVGKAMKKNKQLTLSSSLRRAYSLAKRS